MRVRRAWIVQWTVAGILAAGVAAAQVDVEVEDVEVETRTTTERPPVEVNLIGGIGGYTAQLGDSSDVGAIVGVSVGTEALKLTSPGMEAAPTVGVEGWYEGGTNAITDGFGDGWLWRHNVSTLAKVGVQAGNFDPYVGLGLGISYLNANDQAEDSGFRNDWFGEIPLAAGVEYRVGQLQAGLRGTYRVMFFDEFAEPTPAADNPDGGLLTGQVTLGGRF